MTKERVPRQRLKLSLEFGGAILVVAFVALCFVLPQQTGYGTFAAIQRIVTTGIVASVAILVALSPWLMLFTFIFVPYIAYWLAKKRRGTDITTSETRKD